MDDSRIAIMHHQISAKPTNSMAISYVSNPFNETPSVPGSVTAFHNRKHAVFALYREFFFQFETGKE